MAKKNIKNTEEADTVSENKNELSSVKPENKKNNSRAKKETKSKDKKKKEELQLSVDQQDDKNLESKQKTEAKSDTELEEKQPIYKRFYDWVKYKVFKRKHEEQIIIPNARRIKADPKIGLTLEQVEDRVKKGFINWKVRSFTN